MNDLNEMLKDSEEILLSYQNDLKNNPDNIFYQNLIKKTENRINELKIKIINP